MQLWFHFLGVFSTWLCKWCKLNCPCKLSLRTVILVGHSDLEFHKKLAYELGEFRIFLVAQCLSLNNFLMATWSQVWGSFLIAMSTQVKLGGLQFQQFPYLSLCVLHLLHPPPPVGFVLTISWHPLILHAHREQRAGGKMGRGKMMKCRLQLPAFQPLPLPATLFASMSNQLSTQGHMDSFLSPVPRPGLGLAFTSLYHFL